MDAGVAMIVGFIAKIIDSPFSYIILAIFVWYVRDIYNFLMSIKDIKNKWPHLLEILKDMNDRIKSMNDRIKSMQDSMDNLINPLAQSKSPQSLNDKGRKVAQELDAESFVEKYMTYLKLGENMNAYDIQEACFHFASDILPEKYLTDAEKTNIKDVAYRHGNTERAILRSVIGITLRDAILRGRDINLGQVDTDTPTS
ncbi:MAG: hypothetical protein ACR2OT_00985 [Parvibaculales bacterium]